MQSAHFLDELRREVRHQEGERSERQGFSSRRPLVGRRHGHEGPTIERWHTYIRDRGFVFEGHHQKHHEIYLGDPRRAVPEKLRTIIRQPCSPAESA
jgi:hypothetical protein